MKPEVLAKWEATRAKGMLRYVLVSGVLSYGLAMFVAMTFIANRDKLSPAFVALSAVMWAVGGAVFGVLMWHAQEWQYKWARADR